MQPTSPTAPLGWKLEHLYSHEPVWSFLLAHLLGVGLQTRCERVKTKNILTDTSLVGYHPGVGNFGHITGPVSDVFVNSFP